MNLQTVIDNLDRTIRGKEVLRDEFARGTFPSFAAFVQSNIDELKKIRADLVLVRDNT